MGKPVLGLQLYTVREPLAANFVGVLQKVRQLGYEAVEFAGTGQMTGPQLRKELDRLVLRTAGMHQSIDVLEKNLPTAIQWALDLGTTNVVCSYMPEDRRRDAAGWVSTAKTLDRIGRQCRDKGMKLSYHNHSFEFQKFGGRYGLDILFDTCSPENVLSELDTYWVQHGGEDPVAYINKYAGRIAILHCKDMDTSGQAPTFTEVGEGILDWPAIHKAAVSAGVQYYCVEQDVCPGDPLESARKSAAFLKKLLA